MPATAAPITPKGELRSTLVRNAGSPQRFTSTEPSAARFTGWSLPRRSRRGSSGAARISPRAHPLGLSLPLALAFYYLWRLTAED
jgi:hypothetical protein